MCERGNAKMDEEDMLDKLYALVSLQENGVELSDEQSRRYVSLYETLRDHNVEIPFGVEI